MVQTDDTKMSEAFNMWLQRNRNIFSWTENEHSCSAGNGASTHTAI